MSVSSDDRKAHQAELTARDNWREAVAGACCVHCTSGWRQNSGIGDAEPANDASGGAFECGKALVARGMCGACYRRWVRRNSKRVSVRNYVCGPPFGETGSGSPIPAIVPSVLKRANRVPAPRAEPGARRRRQAPHGGENTAPELTTPPSRNARRSGSRTRCVRRARTSAAPATSARRRAAPGRSASSPPGRSGSGPACGSRAAPRCSGSCRSRACPSRPPPPGQHAGPPRDCSLTTRPRQLVGRLSS